MQEPDLCTTEFGYTKGSFELLSQQDSQAAIVDVDMELWASSSYDEYVKFTGKRCSGPCSHEPRSVTDAARPNPAQAST